VNSLTDTLGENAYLPSSKKKRTVIFPELRTPLLAYMNMVPYLLATAQNGDADTGLPLMV
jgi:hypothetical protein